MKGAHVQIRCSEWTLYTQYCHWFTALSIIRWSKRRHSSTSRFFRWSASWIWQRRYRHAPVMLTRTGHARTRTRTRTRINITDTLLQNCRRTFEVHVHRIETRIVWRPQRWIDEVWYVSADPATVLRARCANKKVVLETEWVLTGLVQKLNLGHGLMGF